MRFIYTSNLILLVTLLALFAVARPSLAFAEDDEEADFSFFTDPNEGKTKSKKETEAEPPCLACQALAKKNSNQKEIKKVIDKAVTQKEVAPKPVSKKEPACIACGKVSLAPLKKNSVVGANIWSNYPDIAGYSENPQVKAMISYAERHAKSVSGGACLRGVKEALCRAPRGASCKGGSLVSRYLDGTPVFPELPSRAHPKIGNNTIKNLKAEKFINLLEKPQFSSMIQNPASAPKGAILVYEGGKNGGHVEIKTGHGTSGSYISDFRAPDSVMRNELAGRASLHYKLVGVMIKPAENL